jgi:hypothetical protein
MEPKNAARHKYSGLNDRRKADPLMDRRNGEGRRQVYDVVYFENGGAERRTVRECRQRDERRVGYIRVSDWSSVCSIESVARPTKFTLLTALLCVDPRL